MKLTLWPDSPFAGCGKPWLVALGGTAAKARAEVYEPFLDDLRRVAALIAR